jgi:TIR domain
VAQIFISHSANHDAGAAAVRDAVAKRLGELKHTPLFDVALINPGDRWRAKLLGWLGSCHGAVILLTNRAVYREWVRAEATIIGWRAYLNPAMLVVPVLLDEDTSSSWLDELGLGPVQLRENIQFLNASELGNPDAEAIAEAIAERFVGYQAGLARDDPMAQWLKRVRVHLDGNRFLEEAAELLGVPELDRIDVGSLCGAVADRLLHSNAIAIEQAVLELIKDPKLQRSRSAALQHPVTEPLCQEP